MKPLRLLLIFMLLPVMGAYANTPKDYLLHSINKEELGKVLLPQDQWVPYPDYTDRSGWDQLLGDHANRYIQRGEALLEYTWQVVPATAYLEYKRSGEREIMERPIRENVDALTELVLAELAEGKGRFIPQIINGAFFTCEMTSWTLSAHLAAAQKSRSPLPEVDDQVIALLSSDIGSLMTWTYYFFHDTFDTFNPEISKRIASELERRIMTPYMTTDRFWWMAFDRSKIRVINNWNPWCNANVLQTFLIMEHDPQRLIDAVYRTMTSVDQFINYIHLDGCCEEGPSYWGHAAGKFYDYLQILDMATGGKVSIFDRPMIRHMGEYIYRSYIGNGWVVNFADASARFDTDTRLIYRFGNAVKSCEMMGFARHLQKENHTDLPGHDLFRALETMRYEKTFESAPDSYTPSPNTWYPETQVCYMRRGDWFMAAKGGFNDESHNHNDIGSYILYYQNQPMIIDVGVGTYTRQTFGKERYTIWTMRSLYHNLPVINDQEQPYGRDYRARSIQFKPKAGSLDIDLTTAYPSEAKISDWHRLFTLTDKGLQINDKYHLTEKGVPTVLHFMIAGTITPIRDGQYQISYKGTQISLHFDAKRFQPHIEKIDVTDPRLTKVWGETIYRLALTDLNPSLKGSYDIRFSK